MPDSYLLVAGACAAALGALVQGSVGFGFALVAAPILTLLDTDFVPGPAIVASIGLNLINVYRTRGGPTDWRGAGWAGAGLVPGTAAAGVTLAALSQHLVAVTVGILILFAVGLALTGVEIRRNPASMVAVGVLSGFMGTAATVGGPPIALAYQREPGATIRATLSRFFLAGSLLAVVVLVPAGVLGGTELVAGLAFLPGTAAGTVLSGRLHRRLDAGWTRLAVLTVSATSAVAVLLRELL